MKTFKNDLVLEMNNEDEETKIDYEQEEERYLDEFNLTKEEKAEADEEVGQIMDEIYDCLERHYLDEYFNRLYAKTEKERYIGRKLELLQTDSFLHFTGMCQGRTVTCVGHNNPELCFPFKRL